VLDIIWPLRQYKQDPTIFGKKGDDMKAFKLSLFVVLVCLFSTPAPCEVSTGFVPSAQDLNQVRSSWKLAMVSTGNRQDAVSKKGRTHGCFIWCILRGISNGPIEIKYSYSYGEPDAEIAAKKAAYAFDSRAGICEKEMPVVEYARGGDF
jgi:hypothetical protein